MAVPSLSSYWLSPALFLLAVPGPSPVARCTSLGSCVCSLQVRREVLTSAVHRRATRERPFKLFCTVTVLQDRHSVTHRWLCVRSLGFLLVHCGYLVLQRRLPLEEMLDSEAQRLRGSRSRLDPDPSSSPSSSSSTTKPLANPDPNREETGRRLLPNRKEFTTRPGNRKFTLSLYPSPLSLSPCTPLSPLPLYPMGSEQSH